MLPMPSESFDHVAETAIDPKNGLDHGVNPLHILLYRRREEKVPGYEEPAAENKYHEPAKWREHP